jgi:hypothetical protein
MQLGSNVPPLVLGHCDAICGPLVPRLVIEDSSGRFLADAFTIALF